MTRSPGQVRRLRVFSALFLVGAVGAVVAVDGGTGRVDRLLGRDSPAQALADPAAESPAPEPLQAPDGEPAAQEVAAQEVAAAEAPAPEAEAAAAGIPAEASPGETVTTLRAGVGQTAVVDEVAITMSPLQAFATGSGRLMCTSVTAANTGQGTPFLSPFTFTLQNPQGVEVGATLRRRPGATPLPTSDLEPGGTSAGEVCFHLSATAGEHVVQYEPFGAADERGAWVQTL